VIWEDSTPGKNEIYYKKSTDGGITWTTGRNLTKTSGDSLFPAISVNSSDSLYAVLSRHYTRKLGDLLPEQY